MQRRTVYRMCQAAGWSCFTAYVLTGYVVSVGFARVRASDIASIVFFNAVAGPLASHRARLTMQRRGWLDLPYRRLLPRLTLLVLSLAARLTAGVLLAEVLLHGHQDLPPSVVTG